MHLASQKVINTYIQNKNVYIKFDNGRSSKITNLSSDTLAILSNNKGFVIYLRTKFIKYNKDENKYRKEINVPVDQIIYYDLHTSKERIIIQTVDNDLLSESISNDFPELNSKISYANSKKYNFSNLGTIYKIFISPDNTRIYFETSAWTVSYAIHYYVISTKNIYFYSAGSINKILKNGNLSISITGLESDINGNSGRYEQDWLYDKDGKEIKPLTKKKF